MPDIEMSAVTLTRNGRDLLRDVDWRVEKGEHWALLGANGAGKSTILSLVGALAFPTSGTVRVLGETLGKVEIRRLRERIGHVNPRHPLRSDLPVTDVVLAGLTGTHERMNRWDPTTEQLKRAEELLEEFGLDPRLRWLTMSQGERGKALIARDLLGGPELMLFDEPSTGLDVAAREEFLRAVDKLPMTSVMVTHHLEELPASTTHALLIADGEVTARGPAEEMITSENISRCFNYPLEVTRVSGRWNARHDPKK